jgi:DNA polymerase I
MSKPKLFLLDSYALIYRAYFAFANNPRINSKGLNTSAVFGFANTLLEILQKEKPDYIAAVFDTAAPTARHTEFEQYKANREAMPEDLQKSIPYIKELLNGFRIPVIELDGYEADDIVGTLARKAENDGFQVFMMTPDKDYGQLVTENTLIYKPARLGNGVEIMGVKEVCERFDIQSPGQVIDILGLMGDKVDNIPGIPGVGEKTAIQLIKQFDNIETLIQQSSELKGKLKEKVETFAEQALLSKRLATIDCEVPVAFNKDELKIEEPDKEKLSTLFKELEFRRMAERILGESLMSEEPAAPKKSKTNSAQISMFDMGDESGEISPVAIYKTLNDVTHDYILVESDDDIQTLIDYLNSFTTVCFDTETNSLDVMEAQLVGLSFCAEAGKAYYVNLPEVEEQIQHKLNLFRPFFENSSIVKVGQNIKFDRAVLENYGIAIKGQLFDTMIAHYLLQPDMRHGMDSLAQNYLGYSPISIETLIGKKGKGQLNMRNIDPLVVKDYAAEDADVTFQLMKVFEPQLQETHTQKVFEAIEMPLIPVLGDMEKAGVKVDVTVLSQLSEEIARDVVQIERQIYEAAGTQFNIASPRQLGEVLFEKLKIDEKAKKTKTGQYATGEEILAKLEHKHPIINLILDYRELQKLKSTYVDTLPLLVNKKTGRIHTSYNQAVAATGRLSSVNPNLQNIPIKTARGREIRKAFVPGGEDRVLVSADYSQIELRIIAELSGEEAMINDFVNGVDIHSATAARVYNVALEEVSSEMRRNAKTVNFGIIYGISAFGLSERLNIPRKEAAQIIEAYFSKYPGIREYMDKSIEKARQNGYVETILGRRRYLRDINSNNAVVRGFAERNAINAPIQGSAADMIKLAMVNIHKRLNHQKLRSKMILQVHDELVFDAYQEECDELKILIREEMTQALKLNVPLEVEIGTGNNWLEAH